MFKVIVGVVVFFIFAVLANEFYFHKRRIAKLRELDQLREARKCTLLNKKVQQEASDLIKDVGLSDD